MMRNVSLPVVLVCLVALSIGLPALGIAAPLVGFETSSLTVAPGSTAQTPSIVVTGATGISAVTLYITVPDDVTLDTSTSGTSIACLTAGSSVGSLFFAEWDSAQRRISITCIVSSSSNLEIVDSIEFTATSGFSSSEEFALSGSVTGGSGSPTFTPLTIEPARTVSFTTAPAVSSATINSYGSTQCSAEAVDSLGGDVTYAWSDGSKGGSFSPSTSSQNPSYTAAANTGSASRSVTLTCVASSAQDSTVKATGQVSVVVRTSGDVDKDGDVDKTDADLVVQYLIGDIAATTEMDANGDGSIAIADAKWILAHQRDAN
ncbi:MAG: dockerin type I domain-containing protein [Armatimonadota bacterium]|nr:dockerin type I domain-containing protein [bacterium]